MQIAVFFRGQNLTGLACNEMRTAQGWFVKSTDPNLGPKIQPMLQMMRC